MNSLEQAEASPPHFRARKPASMSSAALRNPWWIALSVGLLALAFRVFGVQRANDVFIDEVTYADMVREIADGKMPSILGNPFPPSPGLVCSKRTAHACGSN